MSTCEGEDVDTRFLCSLGVDECLGVHAIDPSAALGGGVLE